MLKATEMCRRKSAFAPYDIIQIGVLSSQDLQLQILLPVIALEQPRRYKRKIDTLRKSRNINNNVIRQYVARQLLSQPEPGTSAITSRRESLLRKSCAQIGHK